MRIATDLGLIESQRDAKRVGFQAAPPFTATNIEDAIVQGLALAQSAALNVTATKINFGASPYQVLASDYILEVDTSGGSVVINPQSLATRAAALQVKDVTGNADANNIQINATIEGQTPYLINTSYGATTIRPNADRNAYEVTQW